MMLSDFIFSSSSTSFKSVTSSLQTHTQILKFGHCVKCFLQHLSGTVIVAQLVERMLPKLEIRGSNTDIGKILL